MGSSQNASETNIESGRELVNADVYLTSLVSNGRDVDPLLDTLRQVTSAMPPTGELTEGQKTALLDLRRKLETYLITKEQMRVFTPESLQLQLEHQKNGSKSGRRALLLLGAVMTFVFAATGLIVLALPDSEEWRLRAAGTFFFALVHIGAVILFLAALPAFTTRLRTAFLWFCFAITLLGAALAMQPAFLLLDAYDATIAPIAESLPLLATAVSAYIGARLYVRPFIRIPRVASVGNVSLTIVLMSGLALLLPHAPTSKSTLVFTVVTCTLVAIFVLCTISAALLYRASLRMSDLYLKPTRAILTGLGVAALISLYTSVIRLAFGGPQHGIGAIFQVSLLSIMGISFVYAGYVLNKAARY